MAGFLQKFADFVAGPPPPERRDPREIHISQIGDEVYNATAGVATANCGPTCVIMAVRLLGLDIPGAERYRGEALVEYVRYLGTRSTDRHTGTTNLHLQRVLQLSGCDYTVMTHPKDMLNAVRRGDAVIMGGNPSVPGAYTRRFDYFDIRRYDSGHWILISRYNPERRTFTVNDPQSTIGPIEATEPELYAFSSKDGNFGIAVRPGR